MALEGKVTLSVPDKNGDVIEAADIDGQVRLSILVKVTGHDQLRLRKITSAMVGEGGGNSHAKKTAHEESAGENVILHV
jgi:hypothetical protein